MSKAEEVTYQASKARLYVALLRSVSELGYSINHSDANDATVSFNTGLSMKSWGGQNMTATVFTLEDGRSKLIVGGRRRQTFPVQVFDWGEKGAITRKLVEKLGQVLPEIPEPESAATRGSEMARSTSDELQRLADLRAEGVLTDEEFTAAKAMLLGT